MQISHGLCRISKVAAALCNLSPLISHIHEIGKRKEIIKEYHRSWKRIEAQDSECVPGGPREGGESLLAVNSLHVSSGFRLATRGMDLAWGLPVADPTLETEESLGGSFKPRKKQFIMQS